MSRKNNTPEFCSVPGCGKSIKGKGSGQFKYCDKHGCYSTYNARVKDLRAKNTAYAVLGEVCSVCGFSDRRALQIDHRFGGGRREKRSGRWLYGNVLQHPEKYQILCANCNWIKRVERKESGSYFEFHSSEPGRP